MADTLRIKRRVSGAPGAPSSLQNAELAFNEVDDTLYYGKGTGGGGGGASVILPIGGAGLGSGVTPLMDGTATAGVAALMSRADHVHPTDTSRAPLNSPTFTGVPAGPTATAGTATAQFATCAFVAAAIGALSTGVSSFNTRTGAVTLTLVDVTAVGGAPINSPSLTGTPSAPTPTNGDNSGRIATTQFVLGSDHLGFARPGAPAEKSQACDGHRADCAGAARADVAQPSGASARARRRTAG